MDINIEKRGRRVKRTMPGESAHYAGLSIQEEICRSMYECIGRFIQELSARYGAMKQINNIFQIIETKFMLEASDDALAVAIENLVQIYGEFDKEQVSQEIKSHKRARKGKRSDGRRRAFRGLRCDPLNKKLKPERRTANQFPE
ncbi:hypothetical protein EVAR_83150_1 [Eumeta japonica]|uniref:Uncharacterized protein n=1 Tax=Eumeta variegata TaxID=151549 RepID=A0A4C1YC60_EUMVA|nr:hypothetical protein EVAR_83150_1 [Eumeta japonica]